MSLLSREINIYFDKDRLIRLESEGTDIKIHGLSLLSGNELSFTFIVKEALNCLVTGKDINLHFSPAGSDEDDVIIYKLQWLRGGGLRVIDDHATEKYLHATTIREALERKRNFTCSKSLFKRLPQRRHG